MVNNFCTFFYSQTVQLSLQIDYAHQFFVIYKLSNLLHNPDVVSSPMILNITSLFRHKLMVLTSFASRYSHSHSVMVVGFFDFPSNAFYNPCCTSKSRILSSESSKLFLSLNFSTLNFELFILAISTKIS